MQALNLELCVQATYGIMCVHGIMWGHVQATYAIQYKRHNLFLAQLLLVYMLSLLALFGHFYVTKYSKSSKSMKIKTASNGGSKEGNMLDGQVSPDSSGMKIKSG
jgi:hypothetical protein